MSEDGGNGDEGEKVKVPELLDVVWVALGFAVWVILVAKFLKSQGISRTEDLGKGGGLLMLISMGAATYCFSAIGSQLGREVERGKITWATYWTTLIGIAVATFAFLGVTGIDDFLKLWDSVK
ncbi:hypothetical protein GCM10010121_088080 [Streptomyces brasiliensis]|uniref:Uncharacterized protein n=2 Tax=Streptomyces brasiliensis TaxID=1954 RepID=A0A917UKH4_9ACTN|nr:hypothetical protein GCM10010121_088080 [Streptomyces brasiliensis]